MSVWRALYGDERAFYPRRDVGRRVSRDDWMPRVDAAGEGSPEERWFIRWLHRERERESEAACERARDGSA